MRRTAAILALAFALFGIGAALAPAAWAHAELESSDPAAGASVATAPAKVVLKFSEAVDVDAGSIRVFDEAGKRVAEGAAAVHAPGDRAQVLLPVPPLKDGTYVVTWRVVSDDSHPVHGAFTFRIGPGTAVPNAAAADLVHTTGGSKAVGAVYAVVRFLVFASLLVLVGGTVFVAALWPAGWRHPRTMRLLWAALVVALVGTFLGVLLQGPYGAGLGLADAFKLSVVRPVLRTRFGRVWMARAVLLAVFAELLDLFRRRPRGPLFVGLSTAVGLAVLATPGLSAHAAVGDWVPLALPVDTIHLAAAALWLGGLAMLLVSVLPADPDNTETVDRFSRMALWCVVVLVATGSFQTWRQVRSLDAFTSTTYGRTLLVKLALFAGLVVLAAFSLAAVRRRALGSLRRTVLAEAAVAAGVLAATALLVNAVPARTALATPVTKELVAGKAVVDVTIDPAKAGPAAVHVYTLSQTGEELPVGNVAVRLGSLDVPVARAGPAHFVAYGFTLPAGTQRLQVFVTASDGTTASAATTVKIR